jgi:hypothetical protein
MFITSTQSRIDFCWRAGHSRMMAQNNNWRLSFCETACARISIDEGIFQHAICLTKWISFSQKERFGVPHEQCPFVCMLAVRIYCN